MMGAVLDQPRAWFPKAWEGFGDHRRVVEREAPPDYPSDARCHGEAMVSGAGKGLFRRHGELIHGGGWGYRQAAIGLFVQIPSYPRHQALHAIEAVGLLVAQTARIPKGDSLRQSRSQNRQSRPAVWRCA